MIASAVFVPVLVVPENPAVCIETLPSWKCLDIGPWYMLIFVMRLYGTKLLVFHHTPFMTVIL